MSLCRMTTRPTSPANSRIRSSAGSVRLAAVARDLRRDEFLVDRELADAREHTRERFEDAPDVIGSVHVRGVEPRDHRIESRLLCGFQLLERARDVGVGERVVIKRGVGLQVIRRSEVARIPMCPGLLQRDSEERRATDLVAHDLVDVLRRIRTLLHVVGEVEVAVVEHAGVLRRLGRRDLGRECRRMHARTQRTLPKDVSRLAGPPVADRHNLIVFDSA